MKLTTNFQTLSSRGQLISGKISIDSECLTDLNEFVNEKLPELMKAIEPPLEPLDKGQQILDV